ncbi:MAG: exosortase/archaeosortase family protein [Candidatus Eisenbacteria sp.]|nr:exosortase/archaeosortase family protein [Candidatus Eisenbacteria bacterium]
MTTNLPLKAGGSGSERKRAPRNIAAIVAVAALVVLVYHETLVVLWRTWATNPNYSHGYLIPPVVAFLLWRDRRRYLTARGRGSLFGLVLIGLALLGHIVSIRAGVFMTQGYSLVLLLFGLSLFFHGGRATRTVWFPLGYLVLMLPMPPYMMNVIAFRLKVFAARAGSGIAVKLGIPLARSGMTIHIPAGSLRIADPCSGLRSLIALVALGALFAYLTRGKTWKRVVLFASAVPLAVLANVIRIAVVCVVANIWGIDAALGFFHDLSGLLLFMIAFVGLVTVRKLLRCETEGEETA